MAKKIAVIGPNCVACGQCASVCPLRAVAIYRGIVARVDVERCVGCGKCERVCPAGIIEITTREAVAI